MNSEESEEYINKWDNSDNESEYEDDYIQNEVPPPGLNEEFIKNILSIKHSLYDDIILSPELGTKEAQDNSLIQKYVKQLNNVYILTLTAKKGIIDENSLKEYKPETREQIKNILVWISEFFKKNHINDTIPYENFLYTMLHEYPFIQDNSYE